MTDAALKNDQVLPDHLYDGYMIHRGVLAKGLNVLALPRQVLLAATGEVVPSEISFTHGVPEASTLSAVTFAQDLRLRRALCERADVVVPEGATFTWRSVGRAERWASELGFPVVVKDAQGENPARAVRNVMDEEGVTEAFQALRLRRPEDRSPGSNPILAGYAATRLGYEIDEDGKEVAPLRTRLLVEKQVSGTIIRSAVVGQQVVASIVYGSDLKTEPRTLEGNITSELNDMILRAAHAVPGLGYAMVDTVVSGDPSSAVDGVVVEVGERPRLRTFADVDETLVGLVAGAIVDYQAQQAGLDLSGELASVSGELVIDGLRSVADDAESLIAAFRAHNVSLEQKKIDELEGQFIGDASGRPSDLALVVELLMAGELIDDRAMSVEYRNGTARD